MKRLLYPILCCCLAVLGITACDQDDALRVAGGGGNNIILDLASASLPVSRATVEATGAEVAIGHLDVLIFDRNGNKKWHERVSGTPNQEGEGTITLSAKRSDFTANEGYWVYLIANSTEDVKTFKAEGFTLNALKALKQSDERIHITGMQNIAGGAPQTFLMDGIAYLKADTEPKNASTVVLNNGDPADNTELQVTLRRAAAKIVIRIKHGEYVAFGDRPRPEATNAGYYLRNMPYSTSVLRPETMDADAADLITPELFNGSYFKWTADEITVTAYAYAHVWKNASTLEKEVRLIVNIPMTFTEHNEEGEPTGDPRPIDNSYYQIPFSKDKRLDRNTCYDVTVTVNAPGGSDPSKPVVLTDINYSVYEWQEEHVNVGGEGERPAYLTLNEYDMEMHNMEDDSTTLEFASSSEVEAKITQVYYIDKFGQEKDLELNQETGKYGEKYTTGGGWETHWKNECDITITPDEDINGKIHVHSTVPENNTIRYITFDVTNEDSITKTVTVEQYPLEYITNIQSWYSYRDDFKNNDPNPTTYEYQGDRIYGVSYSNNSYEYESSYYQSLGFLGGYETNTSSGFWRSKVANSHNSNGSSNIKYYYYDSKGDRKESDAETGNARMYHVRITASSGDYTIGNPRITDGYTDPGADNAQLVSPSFMIASRLGFVNTSAGGVNWTADYALDVARKHCKEYVEVYKDKNGNKVALKDWRLPTTAELKIIMKFQGKENEDADAIDYLLNADYYWSASERVSNNKSSSRGTSIRCIRDAYDKKTGK